MKQRMYTLLCACLACLLLAGFAGSVQAETLAGDVVALHGSAWAELNGQRQALALHGPVYAGATLSTDAKSRVQVHFADDTVLSLGPQATVRLDAFVFQDGHTGSLALHFAQGIARVVSGKIVEQNPEGFKLSSPLAVIGIRGTTTMHDVRPDGEMHAVEFLTAGHRVVLTGLDGRSLTFTASGTAVDLRPGVPTPQTPRALTPEERSRVLMLTVPDRFQELTSRGSIASGERGFVDLTPRTTAQCQNTQQAVIDRQAATRHDQEAIAAQLGATIMASNLGNPEHAATVGSLISAVQLTQEIERSLDQAGTAAQRQMDRMQAQEEVERDGGGY